MEICANLVMLTQYQNTIIFKKGQGIFSLSRLKRLTKQKFNERPHKFLLKKFNLSSDVKRKRDKMGHENAFLATKIQDVKHHFLG
jgi:hypothetical protein